MSANIVFATKETIKYIKNIVPLPQERKETDHILGGPVPGPEWPDVVPDRKWLKFAWDNPEIQRVLDGDTFWCVTFSYNSGHRFIWRAKYNEDLNKSERFLAIGSGTKRGRGNSKNAVAEFDRKIGFLFQEECQTPRTLNECYAELDNSLFPKAKKNLETKIEEPGYKFLKDNSVISIQEGLKKSPIWVDVQQYQLDGLTGFIRNASPNDGSTDYIHEVLIVEDCGDFWAVWDSENVQWLKFNKNYKFGSPAILSISKKKLMKYKVKGSSAVFQLNPVSGKLVPYGDGDVLKLVNQTTDYNDIVTFNTIDDLLSKFQFDDWMAAKVNWNSQDFINLFKK